jgi:hypothetical protein
VLLSDHGFTCRVDAPTHDLVGMLDVIASRSDTSPLVVEVLDVGLSDHRLLRWPISLARRRPSYATVTGRPWRQLGNQAFRGGLSSSLLCCSSAWHQYDVDDLSQLYDDKIGALLNRLIPVRTVSCRQRPSDPWFDQD